MFTDVGEKEFVSILLKSVEKEKDARVNERKEKLLLELREEKSQDGDKILWEREVLFKEKEFEMMKRTPEVI